MLTSQNPDNLIDLSGSRWREARSKTATSNSVAPYGLRPSSGQLFGHGNDRLQLGVFHARFAVPVEGPAPVLLGERGPLLALLDWAQRRGVETSGAHEALTPGDPARRVALLPFHQVFVDIQRECAVSGKTAWGLLSGDRADAPVRVVLPTDPATTLLATPTAAVGVGHDGLHLLTRHITCTGWRHTEAGLLLTTPDGQRRLGAASLSARLLGLLGRNAPQIDLRKVRLSALLAPIVDRLAEVATAPAGPLDDPTDRYVMIGAESAATVGV